MSRTELVELTPEGPRVRPMPPATDTPPPPAPPWFARMRSAVSFGDVVVFVGLVLWAIGFWGEPRLALGVPGAVLILWALPPRPPFLQREPTRERG